jgi:hypothetical protein
VRWWEEAILTAEEMRRNFAYGQHSCWVWLALAEQEHKDDMVQQGKRGYALKRAAYKVRRAEALIAKWTPVLQHLAKSRHLRTHALGMLTTLHIDKGKTSFTESTACQGSSDTLVLHLQDLHGLAMATNNQQYEPRCVIFSSCAPFCC